MTATVTARSMVMIHPPGSRPGGGSLATVLATRPKVHHVTMYNVVRLRDQRGAILSGFRGKIVHLGDTLGLSMWQYYYVAWK